MPETLTHPVKASLGKDDKGKNLPTVLVGMAKYNKYANLAEAQSLMGDEKALDALNRQVRTDALNEIRSSATKPIPAEVLARKAQIIVMKRPDINELIDKTDAEGNNPALDAAIGEAMEQLKKEDAARRQGIVAKAQAENPQEAAGEEGDGEE